MESDGFHSLISHPSKENQSPRLQELPGGEPYSFLPLQPYPNQLGLQASRQGTVSHVCSCSQGPGYAFHECKNSLDHGCVCLL